MKVELTGMLEKARSKLRTAHVLLESGSWSDAGSRAYYAVFHAISAALLSVEESYSSHAQVIGMFNRRFVHTGQFPREFTSIMTRLFEDRQSGDYDVTIELSEAEAREKPGTLPGIVPMLMREAERNAGSHGISRNKFEIGKTIRDWKRQFEIRDWGKGFEIRDWENNSRSLSSNFNLEFRISNYYRCGCDFRYLIRPVSWLEIDSQTVMRDLNSSLETYWRSNAR